MKGAEPFSFLFLIHNAVSQHRVTETQRIRSILLKTRTLCLCVSVLKSLFRYLIYLYRLVSQAATSASPASTRRGAGRGSSSPSHRRARQLDMRREAAALSAT